MSDNWQRAVLGDHAHPVFAALDDQIVTGPTLTNVDDFRPILTW